MKRVNVWIDDDGSITGWSSAEHSGEHKHLVGCYIPDEEFEHFQAKFHFYTLVDGVLVYDEEKLLNRVRTVKIAELKEECSQRILNGFTYLGYLFGFSTSDQANITSSMMAFQMGMLTEVEWTVRNLEGETVRVTLNEERFTKMCKKALAHKDSHIKYLRNVLEPKLNALKSVEEIRAFTWEDGGDE